MTSVLAWPRARPGVTTPGCSPAWSPGHTCCVATCHPGHTCGHGDIGCVKDTDCNTGNILHCKFLQQIFIHLGCTHTDRVTKCPFPFIYKEEHRNLGNRVNNGLSQGVEYDQCTSVEEAAPWCSSLTDEHGTHVSGEWFWCPVECLADGQQAGSPHVCLTSEETRCVVCTTVWWTFINKTKYFIRLRHAYEISSESSTSSESPKRELSQKDELEL